uniref:Uncharacterized protein n=1 Tax=Leersia perrieri TaxID=77586 RepID=A0A0D9UZB3_9ORYZ
MVAEMRALEARARACYSEASVSLSSDEFIQLLLLDGCFVLEFFSKCRNKEEAKQTYVPVCWSVNLILADMLLMENQVSFFIVDKFYNIVTGIQGSSKFLLNIIVDAYSRPGDPIRQPSAD